MRGRRRFPSWRAAIVAVSSDMVATAPMAEKLEGERLDRRRGGLGLPAARPLLPPDEGWTRRLRPRRRAGLRSGAASTRTSTTTDARRGELEEELVKLVPAAKRRAGHPCVGRPDRPHDGRVPDRRRAAGTRPHRLRHGVFGKWRGAVPHDGEDAGLERASTRRRVGRVRSSTAACCGKFPPEPIRFVGGLVVRGAVRRKESREDRGRSVDPVTKAVAGLAPQGFFRRPR